MVIQRKFHCQNRGDQSLTNSSCRLPLMTLREITMMQIMNVLTDKPGWHEKVGHVNGS